MNLTRLSLTTASAALALGEFSALELTNAYLERIHEFNPRLNAFLNVTAERARGHATQLDVERARGSRRGPLHGIPVAVKDLMDVRGERTSAGSLVLASEPAAADAFAVAQLDNAGAVLLGKLNLHEFAYGTTNVNPHFGSARNPWAPDRITGGSSGGSAAAIAARLCLGTLGTDTGGSIRIPAALCGVTGVKPTYGRVSVRGVIPLSWSNDHVGPLAQSAEDCAYLLNAIAGYDSADPGSVDTPVPDYLQSLTRPLDGLRLAVPGGYFEQDVDAEILAAVRAAVRLLAASGMREVGRPLAFARVMFDTNRVILRVEAAAYHREMLAAHADRYGADVRKRLQSAATISAADYALARRAQVELIRDLDLYFRDADVLAIPTTRIPAPSQDEDPVSLAEHLTAFTAPFDVTGFPAISLPCGFTRSGLPIGLQLVARKWDEATLLQVAHHYQQATDWHSQLPKLVEPA